MPQKRTPGTGRSRSAPSPLQFTSKGDTATVSITSTGRTTLRPVKDGELPLITVVGFTTTQAKSKSKGFSSKLWSKIKDVTNFVTFDLGGATCRPHVQVKLDKGRPSQVAVGIKCTNQAVE